MTGILLPAAVQERLPSLRECRALFFDFGVWYRTEGEEPAVVVLTDKQLVVATFPKTSIQPLSAPLSSLSGITRNGDRISLRCASTSDIQLMLPKADTFVVHLLDVQDRRMNRALQLTSTGPGGVGGADRRRADSFTAPVDQGPADVEAAAKALRDARSIMAEQSEAYLGVLRLGRASIRTEVPVKEVDEGSDASSVQTVEHELVSSEEKEAIDVAPITVDSTALYRRLWYFFLHYDRTKLRTIDSIIARHRGMEGFLIQNLESVYGPEPSKMRWDTRDQLAHQREINFQLKAQLARAKDELLLIGHEEAQLQTSVDRICQRKSEILKDLDHESSSTEEKFELISVRDGATEFFFAAANGFYDFISEQVKCLVTHPTDSLCLVRRSEGGGTSFQGGIAAASPPVPCSKRLLAVWAAQLGPHSIAMAKAGRWRFVQAAHMWDTFP